MDDDTNARLTALERRLEILPTLATKADLIDMKTSIVMWVTLITLSATALMVFLLHRALPVQPPPQPQIIIVPQQPATPQK